MKLTRNLGMTLLAIWLILTGLLDVLDTSVPPAGLILAILAVAAGALMLLGLRGKGLSRQWGIVLLSAWLILSGLLSLLNLSFAGSGIVLAVLAFAAGGLLLLGR